MCRVDRALISVLLKVMDKDGPDGSYLRRREVDQLFTKRRSLCRHSDVESVADCRNPWLAGRPGSQINVVATRTAQKTFAGQRGKRLLQRGEVARSDFHNVVVRVAVVEAG